MRTVGKITLGLLLASCGFCIESCDIDTCDKVEVNSMVVGKVVANPTMVSNGEEISLEIGGTISASGQVTMNGKDYHPVVYYLIDGDEVVKSTESTLPFSARCKIENLTIGEHVISVDIKSSRSEATFENKVSPTMITVR